MGHLNMALKMVVGKKTLAATAAGGVAGFTLGLGGAAVASFGVAGTFASGVATIGGASTLYIMGAAGISSCIAGNLVDQGLKIETGAQDKFDKNEFTATLMTALPGAILGGALDKLVPGTTKFLTKKMAKELGEEMAYKAQKEWIKTTAKKLKENVKVNGYKISAKNAKTAATKMYKNHIESGQETLKQTIFVTEKGVRVSTILVGSTVTDTDNINKETH